MPNLGGWEFVILIGVLVLLFGAKRLPDMARSIGQSARVFKGEMKGMKNDEGKPADPPAAAAPAPAAPVAPPAELPPATAAPAAPVAHTPAAPAPAAQPAPVAPAPVTPAPGTQNGTAEAGRAAGQGSTGAN